MQVRNRSPFPPVVHASVHARPAGQGRHAPQPQPVGHAGVAGRQAKSFAPTAFARSAVFLQTSSVRRQKSGPHANVPFGVRQPPIETSWPEASAAHRLV